MEEVKNKQTKNNNESMVSEAVQALRIKADNILDMSLLSSFMSILKSSRDSKETIKSVMELCNMNASNEALENKNTAIASIKGISELATQRSTGFNDDKFKRRALNTVKTAVKSVSENLDKKVAVVVCPTRKQEDLSFAAENSHGIVEVLIEKRNKAMARGDLEADAEATALLTTFLKEIDSASETLKNMIEDAFAKGHGTYGQLASYSRRVLEENKKEIRESLLAGKSIEEVASEFKISPKSLSITVSKTIKKSILNSLKNEIEEKKESGMSSEDILKELHLHTSFVNVPQLNEKIKEWRETKNTNNVSSSEKVKVKTEVKTEVKSKSTSKTVA